MIAELNFLFCFSSTSHPHPLTILTHQIRMPFDPRTKSRKTTTLPAALRDELGLPAPSAKRSFRPPHTRSFNNGGGKPQLKAIGRPQSAINGATKGERRGPIKSLRNQEKEQQQQSQPRFKPQQSNAGASSSSRQESEQKKRKVEQQPVERQLKAIKKPKPTPIERKTRLNPFTGDLEVIITSTKKPSSALEKMLARSSEAGSSKGKARAIDGVDGGRKKRKHMSQQEKEEEDEIRWLEYSLGKSRQGEDVVRDDLDDFLDDLDRFQVGMYDESDDESQEEGSGEDSGLESAFASDSGSESEEGESDEEEESGVEEQDGEEGLEEEEVEGMYEFDSNDEADYSNWDAAMATTDEEDHHDSASTDDEEDSEAEEAAALIAGSVGSTASPAAPSAPAAATEGTTTKYIPPALRAKLAAANSSPNTHPNSASADAELDPIVAQKLRRQTQGLLNRLGDSNIDTILTDIEVLYRTHPRFHVTSSLTTLILSTITSRSKLIDTFVILHAALIASLHKVVGVEFAAYFIQRLVEELTLHYEALKTSDGGEEGEERGKECLNLTVLACELYNLHVVACPLIYDLIRMFLGEGEGGVGEVDIELLLKTIRSCGHQLRTDDPTSLKSIISLAQTRVSSSTSTRTKFMLERMADLLKSSKGSKNNTNDPSNPASPAGQLLTKMKKFLGGLGKKRTVKSHEALRIGLKDLKDADKKGKWWLVGAAWTGQSDQGDAEGLTKLLPMNARANAIQSSTPGKVEVDEQQTQLLELARAQGMNTDTRRLVFVTLLSAEDFKQAAENVLLLKLNDVQRREVVRVLVHCVGSEEVYNPYYTLIGQEVCRNDHGMRITLQYCLWDFLREIGQSEVGGEKFTSLSSTEEGKEVDPRRISNLARAYGWWFTHDCLSLQALKTVDFTAVNPRPAQFLGLLMIHIVLSIQSKSPAKTLHMPTVTKGVKEEKLSRWLQGGLVGGSADLSRGLLLFLNTKLDRRVQRKLVLGEDKGLRKKMQPLLEVVEEGLGVVRKTVQGIVQQFDGVGTLAQDEEESMESDGVQDDY